MPIICSICVRDIKTDQASALPCGHVFDTICIQQSLQQENTCPVCQKSCTVSDVKNVWLTRTEGEENIVTLQNRMNEVTLELAEARKEIAYRFPTTQNLYDQIESLKKIIRLQDNEINNLRVKLDESGAGGTVKVNQSDLPAQTAIIEKQAKEIKELKDSIVAHENICSEAKYERKYEKALKKCERLKKEVEENIGYAREMRQDFYDESDEKEREMAEYMEAADKCEREHSDIAESLAKKDKTIRKYASMLKKLNTKVNVNELLNQNTTTASQNQPPRPTNMNFPHSPNPPQGHLFPRQLMPPQQPTPPQQSMAPQQSMPPQQSTAPHNQLVMPRRIMARPPIEPQQQPMTPQQQRPIMQQPPPSGPVANLQWQVYVAPVSTSKKRDVSGTIKQQNASPKQTFTAYQQTNPFASRQQAMCSKLKPIRPHPTGLRQIRPNPFAPSSSREQLGSTSRPIVITEDVNEEPKC